jgi:hypothetical protein
VGAEGIEFFTPHLNQYFGFSERSEIGGIQAFIPQLSIKALTLPVLPGGTWLKRLVSARREQLEMMRQLCESTLQKSISSAPKELPSAMLWQTPQKHRINPIKTEADGHKRVLLQKIFFKSKHMLSI